MRRSHTWEAPNRQKRKRERERVQTAQAQHDTTELNTMIGSFSQDLHKKRSMAGSKTNPKQRGFSAKAPVRGVFTRTATAKNLVSGGGRNRTGTAATAMQNIESACWQNSLAFSPSGATEAMLLNTTQH